MSKPALNHRAKVHFQRRVVHVARHMRTRLQLQKLFSMHRPHDGAIYDQMRDMNFALDPRLLAYHQRARLTFGGADIALDLAIHAQAAGENDVPFDSRAGADEAVVAAR